MKRALLLGLVALAVGGQAAQAYYVAQVAGTAHATADALPVGPMPSVVVRGRTATLTWPAALWTNGDPVAAYGVARGSAAAGGTCTGVVHAQTCSEPRLTPGTWRYAITPRAGSAWSGPQGPLSAAVVVPAPALGLDRSIVGGPLPQTLVGSLTGFDVEEAIRWRLDDPVGGVALTGTPATADANGAAPVSVAVPAGVADGEHAVYAVGSGDDASQARVDVLVDVTPPVTTDSSASVGPAWRTSATVALTAADAGTGVAATYWTTDGTTPTTASPNSTSIRLASDGIFTVRYFSVDRAGNREAVRMSATPVRIDTTAPVAAAPATGSTVLQNGAQLTASASDPTVNGVASGVAAVAYYACAGTCTPSPGSPGTTLIGASSIGPSYGVSWSSQPPDGVYSLATRATDAAGNAVLSTTVIRTVDNSPPQIATELADANAKQAGYINGNADFYAYANVTDAGVGVDPATVKADLSAQCGSTCAATALSTSGGPFTVLTAAGTGTYAYRSALLHATGSPTATYGVSAADLAGGATTKTGMVVIDLAGKPGAPSAVTLANGATATDSVTCATTANGYVNAARAASATVQVTTATNSPANGVLSVTAGSAAAMIVVPVAGVQTATVALDLSGLADGPVAINAVEYTPGGKQVSAATTQTVTKLTAAPTVTIASLVYTDNIAPLADQASSTLAVGPASGFLSFIQTAGTHAGSVYRSAALSAGRLSALSLASETASPTYAVTAVDVACNQGPTATWTPTAMR